MEFWIASGVLCWIKIAHKLLSERLNIGHSGQIAEVQFAIIRVMYEHVRWPTITPDIPEPDIHISDMMALEATRRRHDVPKLPVCAPEASLPSALVPVVNVYPALVFTTPLNLKVDS